MRAPTSCPVAGDRPSRPPRRRPGAGLILGRGCVMGFGFRVGVPGMSVGLDSWSAHLGRVRAARLGMGSGGGRMSTGFGPFYASSSLGGNRRRTSTRRTTRSRAVAPSAAQLDRARRQVERAQQEAERDAAITQLRELRRQMTSVHLQSFPAKGASAGGVARPGMDGRRSAHMLPIVGVTDVCAEENETMPSRPLSRSCTSPTDWGRRTFPSRTTRTTVGRSSWTRPDGVRGPSVVQADRHQ